MSGKAPFSTVQWQFDSRWPARRPRILYCFVFFQRSNWAQLSCSFTVFECCKKPRMNTRWDLWSGCLKLTFSLISSTRDSTSSAVVVSNRGIINLSIVAVRSYYPYLSGENYIIYVPTFCYISFLIYVKNMFQFFLYNTCKVSIMPVVYFTL